jgi:type VI secretion system protein ImpM
MSRGGQASTAEVVFFGKLPGRGDFVRNRANDGLTDRLDRWLSQGLERLAQDPRWKTVYDHAPTADFAFLRPQHANAVCGHLIASADSSGRRFPFAVAARFSVPEPAVFLRRSPLALDPIWAELARDARRACEASDPVPVLNECGARQPEVGCGVSPVDAQWRHWLEAETVGGLQDALQLTDAAVDLRLTLPGLGHLLQPIPDSGAHQLARGLRLPLPADVSRRTATIAFWMELVTPFVTGADFEVALFLPQQARWMAPCLALGFSGDSPALLHALLDPQQLSAQFIDLRHPEWVIGLRESRAGTSTLDAYLQSPAMPLSHVRRAFFDTFLPTAHAAAPLR